jgi:hypothetical protein
MTSAAPELTLCPLTFPYEVSYSGATAGTRRPPVSRRRSTSASERSPRRRLRWPYVVTTGDRRKSHSFDVREFEGACWWPLVYDEKFAGVRQFRDALAGGDLRYLTLLFRSRIDRDCGWGHWTWRSFEDLNAREIKSSNLDAKLGLAQRGAESFLFCGDRVFMKGLDPVYCCVLRPGIGPFPPDFTVDVADPERRPLSVEHPQARPLGNGAEHFDGSTFQDTVFRADEKGKLADFLESRGFSRDFPADIKVMLPQNIRSNPLQLQVASLVQALNRRIQIGGLPAESEYFRPLVISHTKLQTLAAQDKIEIDDGARVLAQLSIWCGRVDALDRYAPGLARTFAEFMRPVHEVVERARAHCGSLPDSTTFLAERDEQALSGLGG